MLRRIVLSTGARLHCGFFAHGAMAARQFGGVGLMIRPPGFELRAVRADADEVLGNEYWRKRLTDVVAHYRNACPAESQPPPVRWEIMQDLPAHAGLGSATQLGLAAATALSLLVGEANVSPQELARRAGRGRRSAIGIHGFAHGGLLIEGGKREGSWISPLLARTAIPPRWRVVLIRPRDAMGLSGADELLGFSQLPAMPEATTDRLCRLALLDLMPAAIEEDFDRFAETIYEFGRLVGESFAPIQGGIYADRRMRELVPRLRARGIHGIGQSSWGPTLYVLCPDIDAARALVADLSADPACATCELTIAEPLNAGATVETVTE